MQYKSLSPTKNVNICNCTLNYVSKNYDFEIGYFSKLNNSLERLSPRPSSTIPCPRFIIVRHGPSSAVRLYLFIFLPFPCRKKGGSWTRWSINSTAWYEASVTAWSNPCHRLLDGHSIDLVTFVFFRKIFKIRNFFELWHFNKNKSIIDTLTRLEK